MTETNSASVAFTTSDGVARVCLGRPSASNALDRGMKERLVEVFESIVADPAVRAVAITAEGKNFCVGQDLTEHAAALNADAATAMETVRDHYNPILRALHRIEVPVVAGVNGACVGAGFGLALAADLRIAGVGATFSTAFAAIGLAADSGLSASLSRAVGDSRARALFLLGDRIDAATAQEYGVVHRLVDDDAVADEALAMATRLGAGPTAAFRAIKVLLDQGAEGTFDDILEREARAQLALGASADHREAVEGFLAKGKPAFSGR